MLHLASFFKTNKVIYFSTILATAFILVKCQSTTYIEPDNNKSEAPKSRQIALPPNSPNTSSAAASQSRSSINSLLKDLPENAKGNSSEIIMPMNYAGKEGTVVSSDERHRQEAIARRTDLEIVGAEKSMEERHARDLGALEQDLELVPENKSGDAPSYILLIEQIRKSYQRKEYEKALIEINEAMRYYPNSAKLLNMKGTLHDKFGQLTLALSAYERAFELEPTRKLEAQIAHLKNLLSERKALVRQKSRLVIPGESDDVSSLNTKKEK